MSCEAKNLDQLRTRTLDCFKKVNQEYKHNLGENTRRRIETIGKFGLVEIRLYMILSVLQKSVY